MVANSIKTESFSTIIERLCYMTQNKRVTWSPGDNKWAMKTQFTSNSRKYTLTYSASTLTLQLWVTTSQSTYADPAQCFLVDDSDRKLRDLLFPPFKPVTPEQVVSDFVRAGS